MKLTQQLKLGQQLTMTPQLQQAIRLLQLSTQELELEVQQALDSNLMLELDEEHEGRVHESDGETHSAAPESADDGSDEATGGPDSDAPMGEEIPRELAVDSEWEDTYDTSAYPMPAGGDGDDGNLDWRSAGDESLHDSLRWQMGMTPFSETDRAIAESLIDAINDDGYLATPVEELHESLAEDLGVELDEVIAVLHRIQSFDPPGVGARDLRESLQIQLRQLPPETPWLPQALELTGRHFDLLAGRDFAQLRRKLHLDEPALLQVIQLIQSLNPRPGSQISREEPQYITPDVVVWQRNGEWHVELNPEATPRLRINSYYAGLIRQARSEQDAGYLKNHLQEARWFIKSLQSRSQTLLKVARAIVDKQRDFLEHGEEAMRALVLADIAEEVEMHESTISRVTTRKYMHTPRGIFELKYFFSSHVGTADGGECSSTAIRAVIKKLIAAEEPRKPLSDNQIAGILGEQGINVARRTVAKYREAMGIAPSNERKRLC